MKNLPLISVIIPVYNILEYLPRCVQSVENQTYGNLEILLVDDGSTDGTGALCDELAQKNAKIRVFHKENGGSSSARNLGIRQAKGEYLSFVDSDDYIEPWMIEKLYEGITTYNVKIAQIGRNEIDEQGNLLPDICIPPTEPVLYSDREFLKELLLHRGDCSFCTKLIAGELFEQRQFPEGLLNEDFRLLVEMLGEADKLLSLPGYGYHVFYRMGSNSRKKDREDFSRVYGDCVDNADLAEEMVRENYPHLLPVAKRFGIFQRLEYLLHIPISQMTRDNKQYGEIVRFLRKNWWAGMTNPFLTAKNKCYHTLFALAPKTIRVVHKRFRGIK